MALLEGVHRSALPTELREALERLGSGKGFDLYIRLQQTIGVVVVSAPWKLMELCFIGTVVNGAEIALAYKKGRITGPRRMLYGWRV